MEPVPSSKRTIPKDCLVEETEKSRTFAKAIALNRELIDLEKERIVILSAICALEKKLPGTDVRLGDFLGKGHIKNIMDSASMGFYPMKESIRSIVIYKLAEVHKLTKWAITERQVMWAIISAMSFLPEVKRHVVIEGEEQANEVPS